MERLEPFDAYSKSKEQSMKPIKLGYTKLEAAEALTLSVRMIDYLIQKRKLRAVKIGARVIIPTGALEALLQKGVQ